MTPNEEASRLIAKINCSDSPIRAAWWAMNFLIKGLRSVDGSLPVVLEVRHETKIEMIPIKNKKIIATTLKRLGFNFSPMVY
jgi:hypothetical protein